jgi:Secretion system C-terminal sorting domain
LKISQKLGVLIILSILLASFKSYSQPQWKFHIAFEDATGAKDTIWWIWDSTATSGLDTALGEVIPQLNHNAFNVYIFNTNSDTTKTEALPYAYFPNHSAIVYAINYQYPIIIRWDSSLFHSSFLPATSNNFINVARISNDYFFFVNNNPPPPLSNEFDMLLDNSAYAPAYFWGSQSQFPMVFGTTWFPLGIKSNSRIKNNNKIFPNPTNNFLTIQNVDLIKHIEIVSLEGFILKTINYLQPIYETNIDISNLASGFYLIKIITKLNTSTYEKISKTN